MEETLILTLLDQVNTKVGELAIEMENLGPHEIVSFRNDSYATFLVKTLHSSYPMVFVFFNTELPIKRIHHAILEELIEDNEDLYPDTDKLTVMSIVGIKREYTDILMEVHELFHGYLAIDLRKNQQIEATCDWLSESEEFVPCLFHFLTDRLS